MAIMKSMFCFWLALMIRGGSGAPAEDKVEYLPLYGKPPTAHYSGYLDATDGCNTEVNGGYCRIHYWFAAAEAENEYDDVDDGGADVIQNDKPVVLWSNGGPGGSSVIGFVQELGPLLINATGGLMVNPYSWTNVANLFILEAPVGVGYSYCAKQAEEEDGLCENTDKFTASASRAALVDFFVNKFPELRDNDFFITGESYAGVYIPTLSYEILVHNKDSDDDEQINLVGFAVGDPCTDNDSQRDSMDAIWYGYKYGLIDDETYDILWNQCNITMPSFLTKNPIRYNSDALKNEEYDYEANFKVLSPEAVDDFSMKCKVAFRKFMMSTSHGLSQSWRDMYIDDYSLFAPISFDEDNQMQAYMNRADVREALHVTDTPIKSWPFPDSGFDYTKEYDACNDDVDRNADPRVPSMIDFYKKIVPSLRRIWVYNGDTDPCVSYEGTRVAVKKMGFPELDGGAYRPWFYDHSSTTVKVLQEKAVLFGPDLSLQSTGPQFGGEIVNYENNLAFLTFHGSGHMVPQFRPQAALHMLTKFVQYEDLSPPMPSNEAISKMCDHCFHHAMDKWTEKAKAAPYVTPTADSSETFPVRNMGVRGNKPKETNEKDTQFTSS